MFWNNQPWFIPVIVEFGQKPHMISKHNEHIEVIASSIEGVSGVKPQVTSGNFEVARIEIPTSNFTVYSGFSSCFKSTSSNTSFLDNNEDKSEL